MSIELKRNLLRISKEISSNNNIPKVNNTIPVNNVPIISENKPVMSGVNRIKTEIKSQYLGNKLYPDYIGKYKGSSFIVAGCGTSLNFYSDFSKYFVIGVNDIERILTPDFLIVVNDIKTFMRGRWEYVKTSLSPVIFSHMDDPGPIDRSAHLVKLKIGKRDNPNLDQFDTVDHTMNSPYMGVIIAYQLGARKIGIVGVDFTDDHFFSKTGTHKLTRHVKTINDEYNVLGKELIKRGIKIANLSSISLLTSWPKMSLDEFDSL